MNRLEEYESEGNSIKRRGRVRDIQSFCKSFDEFLTHFVALQKTSQELSQNLFQNDCISFSYPSPAIILFPSTFYSSKALTNQLLIITYQEIPISPSKAIYEKIPSGETWKKLPLKMAENGGNIGTSRVCKNS